MEIEVAGGSYSGGDGDRNVLANGADRGTYLVWEDLRVVLPNFGNKPTKRLLHGLRGFAEPGRIMAIMGPSGSGKSTLLDSLAGFLTLSFVGKFQIYSLSSGCISSQKMSFLSLFFVVFGVPLYRVSFPY